ncbi:hypothetical protein K493DRAFT_376770 [Basidiobolus meristosporus CBS 931.73]|uniref:G-protein coupled receptors family 2 profile 2 domain-containing protein n=1 Tax=Basidiobolus meristosporus CBS 931.73 TaxID=1314790 RepID=A0A1Y1Y490_9FUNG|nr:hypothetical protein K493DRAFT_376770 [Basidiobolus meristosporus CBS 931.73]|eukprot:ORX92536.1 hypothetical protein K493DRAFT_376770 [Basidiobolus meristosporus CBS 931.73]
MASDSFICSLSVWGLIYFTLASVFLRLAVVVNIQLAVVKSTKNASITELHYLLVATILPLLLSIVPACANLLGWTTHEGTCWFRDDGKSRNFIWQWFSYYMWVILGVLYSIVSILLIVRYLRKQKSEIQEDMEAAVPRIPLECNPLPHSQSADIIKQTVYRTCWYPIIPTISQSFVMVNALILTAKKEILFPVYLISIIGTALQGTLTAIVFANDPVVEESCGHFRRHLIKKYYYDYEQVQHLPPKDQNRKGSIASLLSNVSSHETTAVITSIRSPGFTAEGGTKINSMATNESIPITQPSFTSWFSHLMYRFVRRFLVREMSTVNEIDANVSPR